METLTYQEALRRAMFEAFEHNPNSILLGQGVSDPASIFGTTLRLAETFGEERVIDTAIAEEGVTGVAIGAALNGLYPIQTHIRVDFLILAMNQIVNMAAKYKHMYGGTFEAPMLIRAVVGRSWGQGPQHSQSLQSLFSHIPGLTVIMPSSAEDVLRAYRYVVNEYKSPVISIEHRLLYNLLFQINEEEDAQHPLFSARLVQRGEDVTIVATSYMVQEAQKAANWVKTNQNIDCEIIDLYSVSDVDHEMIYQSISKTGHLIIADTSWLQYGVCAEVCRGIMQTNPAVLKRPVIQLGMKPTPCPTSHALEYYFYSDMGAIVDAIYTQVYATENHRQDLPSEDYKNQLKKEFKGPF